MKVEEIVSRLIESGSKFNDKRLEKIIKQLEHYINGDYSYEEISEYLAKNLQEKTGEFLYDKNQIITGISTSVFLNPGIEVNIIGGNLRKNQSEKIDENTLFDIASITKLYFGLLIMYLNLLGIIDRKELINNLTNDFDLPNYSVDDLVNMRGIIKTLKRIDECSSDEDAFNVLQGICVETDNKDIYNYTDMGVIILTYILEKLFGMNYDQILKDYILNPLGLSATYFPGNNITGNGRLISKPHDPKAFILNKALGHAGMFVNGADLVKLSKGIFSERILPLEKVREFCINKSGYNRGVFGAFVHHPNGLADTYVPKEFSKDSFAYEGFTGSVVVFDLINQIHNSILVNAIDEETMLKSSIYRKSIRKYQEAITDEILKFLILDRYFSDNNGFVKKLKI